MFALKSLLSAIVLTTSVVSPAAQAQWEVKTKVDKWDRPTTDKIALSPIYEPVNFLDIFLYVAIRVRQVPDGPYPDGCEMALIFAKEPDLKEEQEGKGLHALSVLIDNEETVAVIGKISPKVFLLAGREGEFDARTLALADSLEIIMPYKKGNHLLEFDMTGSKRAIAEVCEFD